MAKSVKSNSRSKAAAKQKSTKPYLMKDQVGFLMRVAMQRHTSIFMSLMAHDLTQTQFAALAKLMEVGTCSQNHLGRLIYLDAATIKGVVDRLRRRKLVDIQLNPDDRRRSMIAITKTGQRVATDAIGRARRITERTLVPLKPQEQKQIVRLLQKMI
jgi:DNA-binding MarR family transcriptional regulator